MAQINITTLDRDTYVAFRAQWKTDYIALSGAIRELRIMTKNQMRAGQSTGGNQNTLRSLSSDATTALAHLAEAKERLKALTTEALSAAA